MPQTVNSPPCAPLDVIFEIFPTNQLDVDPRSPTTDISRSPTFCKKLLFAPANDKDPRSPSTGITRSPPRSRRSPLIPRQGHVDDFRHSRGQDQQSTSYSKLRMPPFEPRSPTEGIRRSPARDENLSRFGMHKANGADPRSPTASLRRSPFRKIHRNVYSANTHEVPLALPQWNDIERKLG